MKLKLIQTGGFIGKTKVAEADLTKHEGILQDHVAELFNQDPQPVPQNKIRDKEQLFLEFNGKVLPLYQLELNPQLAKLIADLNGQLCFKK
ncbi:MAG: hypothetical protein EOP41_01110 [Sphingobacteriaceae bacterium]|nr:MAG: hypothetical protein EOP41_01110 [Sphingobacteriaceae bacterium]